MRSLKLSGLIRRNPDRPSLKQRAAALKATAGRVIRPTKSKGPTDVAGGLIADLHNMTGGVIHGDGKVSFCDADGRVLRKPVTDWIGFTASRLYASARKEMARQVNDPILADADRDALALKLRRDLRLDALHVLAFRSAEAFDLTQAKADAADGAVIPEPRRYRAGPVSMDLQQAIEAHREAVQMAVIDPVDDADRTEARCGRIRALADAVRGTPARSHADLRHKAIYLWPGNIEGETVDEDLSESLISIFHDIERLGTASEPEGYAVDPVLAAIAASRAAEAEMAEWQTQASARSDRLTEAMFAEEHQLCIVQSRTRDVALSTVPTTHAGRLALVEYVRFVMGLYGMGEESEGADNLHVWKQTHATLMEALAAPVAGFAKASGPDLSGATPAQLGRLYETVTSIWRHASAETQSPCFWDEKSEDHNPAGRVLDAEADRLADLLSAIEREAKLRAPQSGRDRDERLNVLALHELLCEGRFHNRALMAGIAEAWGA